MKGEKSLPAVNKNAETPACFKKLEVEASSSNTQAAIIIHLPAATLEIQNGAARQTVEVVLLALKSIC